MSNPYKTREGGATVTVFVPYDCHNNCPFCINKKEYADCSGFSLEKIIESIRVMDSITPYCDFVFTGGEPLADLESLQKMLDTIPSTHKFSAKKSPICKGFTLVIGLAAEDSDKMGFTTALMAGTPLWMAGLCS